MIQADHESNHADLTRYLESCEEELSVGANDAPGPWEEEHSPEGLIGEAMPVLLPTELEMQAAELKELAKHLMQSADEINSLLIKADAQHTNEEQYHLREASVLACATLEKVLESRDLRKGISLLAKTWSGHLTEAVSELTEGFEGFLEQERSLLSALGASDKLIASTLDDCRKLIEDAQNGKAPRGKLFEAIGRIREATCTVANDLRAQAVKENEKERVRKIVIVAVKSIGGVGLVILNASEFIAQNVPGPFVVASGACGAGLIQAAAQEL